MWNFISRKIISGLGYNQGCGSGSGLSGSETFCRIRTKSFRIRIAWIRNESEKKKYFTIQQWFNITVNLGINFINCQSYIYGDNVAHLQSVDLFGGVTPAQEGLLLPVDINLRTVLTSLIKKKIEFSSFIRKFRWERLQSNIGLTASSYTRYG